MKVLYFDCETTGVDPNRHGLIQLGQIIEVDGQVVSENVWNIQPFKGDEIVDEALVVNRIHRDDLFDNEKRLPVEAAWHDIQKSWDQVVDKFNPRDKFVLAGYNVDAFDQQFLRRFIAKVTPNDKYSVAGCYLGHFTMDPLPYLKWLKVLGFLKLDNLKLQTVCDHLGIQLKDAHDALADIRATRWLTKRVQRQIEEGQWASDVTFLHVPTDGETEGQPFLGVDVDKDGQLVTHLPGDPGKVDADVTN